jgi:hypothetical protein
MPAITFSSPINLWADDIVVRRTAGSSGVPPPWQALSDEEEKMFATIQDAATILNLAQAATPGATLVNGPEADRNFAHDVIDPAVTYQFMHAGIDRFPYVVQGTYKTGGQVLRVLAYVQHLVREYTPDKTKLVITLPTPTQALYTWA